MRSPKWKHRLSLTLCPLRRTTSIQEQNTTERILEHGYEAEAPLHSRTTETKTDCIRRVREVAPHCLFPMPTPCREVSPEPLLSPVGNENPGTNQPPPSIVGCFVGAPTQILHHKDFRGMCGAQSLNLSVTEGVGACNNQHKNLGQPSSYLQCRSSNQNQLLCSSSEQSPWCTLTRELGRVQICRIWILKQLIWLP